MSPFTGSVDSHDGWEYEDEDGNILDGVERGEALEVDWDEDAQEWGEIDWGRDLWKAYMTDQGCWIAEGNFLGQFIIVEGTTRKEAIKGWQDVATKKANKKAKSYDIN